MWANRYASTAEKHLKTPNLNTQKHLEHPGGGRYTSPMPTRDIREDDCMSTEYRRIYLPLGRAEFIALQEQAQREMRHPRDHARFLLRAVLLDDAPEETRNRDAVGSDAQRVAAAT